MLRLSLAILVFLFCGPLWAHHTADYVIVKKSERRLELMQKNKVIRSYKISLGFSPVGHKTQQGDGRTPEGIYKITWKQEQTRFHLALHINYPNKEDRALAKRLGVNPGGDIKIHGLENKWGWADKWVRKPIKKWDWTDGCIAVTNDEIEEIWSLVKEGTTIEIRP